VSGEVVLEVFSGTESFSKIMRKAGSECFTIDNDPYFKPTLCKDILKVNLTELPKNITIIWASPPCQAFTVAQIGRNWNKDHTPKTEKALLGLKLLDKTIEIISLIKPAFWIIENPRGKMRKVIEPVFKKYAISNYVRNTVFYCQYGDKRMKPTDLWSDLFSWIPKPMCNYGDNCHEKAPRGSKTGTQGLKNSRERSIVPQNLCIEIAEVILGKKIPTFLEKVVVYEQSQLTDFLGVKT